MRIIAILITTLLLFNLVACNNDTQESSVEHSGEISQAVESGIDGSKDDSSSAFESEPDKSEESEESEESEKSDIVSEESEASAESEASEEFDESEQSEQSEASEEDKIYQTSFADPLEVGYTKYTNPFIPGIADPDIVYHDGKYYCLFGAWGCLFVSTFDDLGSFTTDGANVVLIPTEGKPWAGDIWAPELHFVDGYWYIYFAGGTPGVNSTHRMYVAKSKTSDPMGEYEEPIKLTDPTDKWAIDGTVFKYKEQLYFVWSGWEGDEDGAQNLYIAKMESPTKISGTRYLLSQPTYPWEKRGGSPKVNEGPYAIVDGDYLTILYSASGSWCDDYCIGQLLFSGDDILDINSWTKKGAPIIQTMRNKFYGPGHCTVAPDENGVLWMIFHANLESGTGWEGRSGWMYPIRIKDNGFVEVVIY